MNAVNDGKKIGRARRETETMWLEMGQISHLLRHKWRFLVVVVSIVVYLVDDLYVVCQKEERKKRGNGRLMGWSMMEIEEKATKYEAIGGRKERLNKMVWWYAIDYLFLTQDIKPQSLTLPPLLSPPFSFLPVSFLYTRRHGCSTIDFEKSMEHLG